MKIQIHNLKNFNCNERQRIIRVCKKGGPLIASPMWEKRILNCKLTETHGYSNEDIIKMIRLGADGPNKQPDLDLDLTLIGYYRWWSRVIGWTNLNSFGKQRFNKKYFPRLSDAALFGHFVHEIMHGGFGFTHNYAHETSVPYQVGYQTELTYAEYYYDDTVPIYNPNEWNKYVSNENAENLNFPIDFLS